MNRRVLGMVLPELRVGLGERRKAAVVGESTSSEGFDKEEIHSGEGPTAEDRRTGVRNGRAFQEVSGAAGDLPGADRISTTRIRPQRQTGHWRSEFPVSCS